MSRIILAQIHADFKSSPKDQTLMEIAEHMIYTYWYIVVPAVGLLLFLIVYRRIKRMQQE